MTTTIHGEIVYEQNGLDVSGDCQRRLTKQLAFLLVTPELLVEICKGLTPNQCVREYRVVDHALPADAELIYAKMHGREIRLAIRSQEFSAGELLPAPVLEAIEHCGASPRLT